MTITPDQINGLRWRGGARIKFSHGEGWFYRNDTIRRLQRLELTDGRRVRWMVDGSPVADLEEALSRLTRPAALDERERAELAHIPETWTPMVEIRTARDWQHMDLHLRLIDKGAIEVEHVEESPGVYHSIWRRAP